MSTMAAACAVFILLIAGSAYGDGCSEKFGEKKVHPCERAKCSSIQPPEELRRIRRGGYAEYVGLFINDGRAIWCGFDIETGEVIRVDRYGGRKLSSAPEVVDPTTAHYRRQADKMIDVVTRGKVSREELDGLICLSNALWKSSERNMDMATDVHNAIVLLDGDQGRMFGGPGVLTGPAARLEKMLCGAAQEAR